jgi:DNA-binding MarR family transcriptional regulator
MTTKQQRFWSIMHRLNHIKENLKCIEDKPLDFGLGIKLYKSEMHMISVIGESHGANITRIAEQLNITKGAVSQVVNKLHKKDLVRKVQEVDNKKEILLILTDKGKMVFDKHQLFHQHIFECFASEVKDVKIENIEIVDYFLEKTIEGMACFLKGFSEDDFECYCKKKMSGPGLESGTAQLRR